MSVESLLLWALVISKKIKEQKHEIPFSLSQVGLLDFYSGL